MKKAISLLLIACLLWTSCNLCEAALYAPQILSSPPEFLPQFELTPPASLGHIVDYFHASPAPVSSSEFRVPSSNPKLVVLIQDLHAHYGVQKNIAGLLEFLADRLSKIPSPRTVAAATGRWERASRTAGTGAGEGSRSRRSPSPPPSPPVGWRGNVGEIPFVLAVEGAEGPIDSSVMALFPNDIPGFGARGSGLDSESRNPNPNPRSLKEEALDYLMREGELTGMEYFAAMQRIPDLLVGVEDMRYYTLHRDLFRKTFKDRAELVKTLTAIQASLVPLRREVYSKNLKRFQKRIDAFEKRKISPEEYLAFLISQAKQYGMEISQEFPTLANFSHSTSSLNPHQIRELTARFLQTAYSSLTPQERKTLAHLVKGSPEFRALSPEKRPLSSADSALSTQDSALSYFLYLRDLIYTHQLFMTVPPELARYFEYLHTVRSVQMDKILHEAGELAYRIKRTMISSEFPSPRTVATTTGRWERARPTGGRAAGEGQPGDPLTPTLSPKGARGNERDPKRSSQSDFIQVEHDLNLLLKVADLQATESEVRAFGPRLSQFMALAESLLRSTDREADLVKRETSFVKEAPDVTLHASRFTSDELRRLISSSLDYYAMALLRNKPMVEKTLALLQKYPSPQTRSGRWERASRTDATETLASAKVVVAEGTGAGEGQTKDPLTPTLSPQGARGKVETVVLVAGGFHTAPLTQLLKEKNVSYLVITPTVDKITPQDHELYVKRLNGALLSTQEILATASPSRTAPAGHPKLITGDKSSLAYVLNHKKAFLTAACVLGASAVLTSHYLPHFVDLIQSYLGTHHPDVQDWVQSVLPELTRSTIGVQPGLALGLVGVGAGIHRKRAGSDINLAAGPDRRVSHRTANKHIEKNLPPDLIQNKSNITHYPYAQNQAGVKARVIPIPGLWAATHQLAHIGLGQVYGEPVFYIDEDYKNNQEVWDHELYEIGKWENLRKHLKVTRFFRHKLRSHLASLVRQNKITQKEMNFVISHFHNRREFTPMMLRWWIRTNYSKAVRLAEKWHRAAPSINHLIEGKALPELPPEAYEEDEKLAPDINLGAREKDKDSSPTIRITKPPKPRVTVLSAAEVFPGINFRGAHTLQDLKDLYAAVADKVFKVKAMRGVEIHERVVKEILELASRGKKKDEEHGNNEIMFNLGIPEETSPVDLRRGIITYKVVKESTRGQATRVSMDRARMGHLGHSHPFNNPNHARPMTTIEDAGYISAESLVFPHRIFASIIIGGGAGGWGIGAWVYPEDRTQPTTALEDIYSLPLVVVNDQGEALSQKELRKLGIVQIINDRPYLTNHEAPENIEDIVALRNWLRTLEHLIGVMGSRSSLKTRPIQRARLLQEGEELWRQSRFFKRVRVLPDESPKTGGTLTIKSKPPIASLLNIPLDFLWNQGPVGKALYAGIALFIAPALETRLFSQYGNQSLSYFLWATLGFAFAHIVVKWIKRAFDKGRGEESLGTMLRQDALHFLLYLGLSLVFLLPFHPYFDLPQSLAVQHIDTIHQVYNATALLLGWPLASILNHGGAKKELEDFIKRYARVMWSKSKGTDAKTIEWRKDNMLSINRAVQKGRHRTLFYPASAVDGLRTLLAYDVDHLVSVDLGDPRIDKELRRLGISPKKTADYRKDDVSVKIWEFPLAGRQRKITQILGDARDVDPRDFLDGELPDIVHVYLPNGAEDLTGQDLYAMELFKKYGAEEWESHLNENPPSDPDRIVKKGWYSTINKRNLSLVPLDGFLTANEVASSQFPRFVNSETLLELLGLQEINIIRRHPLQIYTDMARDLSKSRRGSIYQRIRMDTDEKVEAAVEAKDFANRVQGDFDIQIYLYGHFDFHQFSPKEFGKELRGKLLKAGFDPKLVKRFFQETSANIHKELLELHQKSGEFIKLYNDLLAKLNSGKMDSNQVLKALDMHKDPFYLAYISKRFPFVQAFKISTKDQIATLQFSHVYKNLQRFSKTRRVDLFSVPPMGGSYDRGFTEREKALVLKRMHPITDPDIKRQVLLDLAKRWTLPISDSNALSLKQIVKILKNAVDVRPELDQWFTVKGRKRARSKTYVKRAIDHVVHTPLYQFSEMGQKPYRRRAIVSKEKYFLGEGRPTFLALVENFFSLDSYLHEHLYQVIFHEAIEAVTPPDTHQEILQQIEVPLYGAQEVEKREEDIHSYIDGQVILQPHLYPDLESPPPAQDPVSRGLWIKIAPSLPWGLGQSAWAQAVFTASREMFPWLKRLGVWIFPFAIGLRVLNSYLNASLSPIVAATAVTILIAVALQPALAARGEFLRRHSYVPDWVADMGIPPTPITKGTKGISVYLTVMYGLAAVTPLFSFALSAAFLLAGLFGHAAYDKKKIANLALVHGAAEAVRNARPIKFQMYSQILASLKPKSWKAQDENEFTQTRTSLTSANTSA